MPNVEKQSLPAQDQEETSTAEEANKESRCILLNSFCFLKKSNHSRHHFMLQKQ